MKLKMMMKMMMMIIIIIMMMMIVMMMVVVVVVVVLVMIMDHIYICILKVRRHGIPKITQPSAILARGNVRAAPNMF